ncbi:MAG: YbjN domain-containing protein [Ruminococcaceae bacterium]|nr:YbjN domain-containing protein [Oscillospiraceae bacterium]
MSSDAKRSVAVGKKQEKPVGGAAYAARIAFLKKLDAEKVKYSTDGDRPVVRIYYNGANFRNVCFSFVFDEDGLSAGLRAFSVAQFRKDELSDAHEFCNRMNSEYRWVRFFVDSDRELTVALDAVLTPETVASVCYELLERAVSIVDSVCKELKK